MSRYFAPNFCYQCGNHFNNKFPLLNQIIPYDGVRLTNRKPSEGKGRVKFNFVAQTPIELSLVKGELVIVTRQVDEHWLEGRIGQRRGIFPITYVDIIQPCSSPPSNQSKFNRDEIIGVQR